MNSEILNFFADDLPWRRAIINSGNDFWEKEHTFIQWMFPLPESSRFNQNAPVLTVDDVVAFRESSRLQSKLFENLTRFRKFLEETHQWLEKNDHNHLRISRVIRCLRILVNEECAENFRLWIYSHENRGLTPSKTTEEFWIKSLELK